MAIFTKSWKNCATCAYWTGARSCDCFNSQVSAEHNAKGKCIIPRGGWKGVERSATQSCVDWEKYPGLK